MGIKYLWDTNTVIYFLNQAFPPDAEKFIDETLLVSPPAISAITEIELLCWKNPDSKKLEELHQFINDIWVFELEKDIKTQTAEFRKAYNIKLPDAIIAATAMVYNITLISRNTKDFKNIDGLKVIDPFNL